LLASKAHFASAGLLLEILRKTDLMLALASPVQGVVTDAKNRRLLFTCAVDSAHLIDLLPVYLYQWSSHCLTDKRLFDYKLLVFVFLACQIEFVHRFATASHAAKIRVYA